MVPGTAKRILPLGRDESVDRPVPLHALFVLECGRSREVSVRQLSPAAACLDLLRASFNLVVNDRARRENQFRRATELAGAVPVYRLRYPRSLSSLPRVCDAVLASLTT
jgi:hypothetical protein